MVVYSFELMACVACGIITTWDKNDGLVNTFYITNSSRIAYSAIFYRLWNFQKTCDCKFSKQKTLDYSLLWCFLLCSHAFMKGCIDSLKPMKNGKLSLVALNRTSGLFKISELHFLTKYYSGGRFVGRAYEKGPHC